MATVLIEVLVSVVLIGVFVAGIILSRRNPRAQAKASRWSWLMLVVIATYWFLQVFTAGTTNMRIIDAIAAIGFSALALLMGRQSRGA